MPSINEQIIHVILPDIPGVASTSGEKTPDEHQFTVLSDGLNSTKPIILGAS